MPGAVVPVHVDAREIAYHHEVEVCASRQPGKRSAVRSPKAFRSQAGSEGSVAEIAEAVVQKQIRRIAIVGIVVRRGYLPVEIRTLVLGEKQVQVAVAIDITTSENLGVLQRRIGPPHQSRRLVKCSGLGATVQKQTFGFGAQKIGKTVPVEIGNYRAHDPSRVVSAEGPGPV